MSLNDEIEKAFPQIEKFLLEKELIDFMYTPAGSIYISHHGLTMWIRNVILHERKKLYRMFLDNNIECVDTMTETVLRLFHSYVISKYKQEYIDKRKVGKTLVWCKKRQKYVYNTERVPPEYVIL